MESVQKTCGAKALHGHADAGTFWEQHCDESVRAMGFEPVDEECPSVYTHPQLQLVLVVYVDGFKMAGSKKKPQKRVRQHPKNMQNRAKKREGVRTVVNKRSQIM